MRRGVSGAVAWDQEMWCRVFAVTTVEPRLSDRLLAKLEKVEPRKTPFWVPGPSTFTPAIENDWREIENAAVRSSTWWLVEAHSPVEPAMQRPLDSLDAEAVLAEVRAKLVSDVTGESLTDRLLEQLRSQNR